MQSENNIMSGDGSPTARFALATLAQSLNLNEAALKLALEGAFNIHSRIQYPGHALRLALARLGYHFDNNSFYAVLNTFHNTFTPALGGSYEFPSSITVPWMSPNPYRALKGGFGPQDESISAENTDEYARYGSVTPSRQQYREYAELAGKALSYRDSNYVLGFDQSETLSSNPTVKDEHQGY